MPTHTYIQSYEHTRTPLTFELLQDTEQASKLEIDEVTINVS